MLTDVSLGTSPTATVQSYISKWDYAQEACQALIRSQYAEAVCFRACKSDSQYPKSFQGVVELFSLSQSLKPKKTDVRYG